MKYFYKPFLVTLGIISALWSTSELSYYLYTKKDSN